MSEWVTGRQAKNISILHFCLVENWRLNYPFEANMLPATQSYDEISSLNFILLYDISVAVSNQLCFSRIYYSAFNLVWLWFIIQIKTQHRHFDLTNFKMCALIENQFCLQNWCVCVVYGTVWLKRMQNQRFITFYGKICFWEHCEEGACAWISGHNAAAYFQQHRLINFCDSKTKVF